MSASILIVEDSPDNLKLICWVLEDEDFRLTTTGSAEEAMDLIERETFDLVLMDISLPGIRGDEATRRLRRNPRFQSLPIIAVTAHAISSETEQILASGVSAIVTKPIDEDLLIETIYSWLGQESHRG